MIWVAIRDSLWFLPGLLTIAGGALAFSLIQVDRSLLDSDVRNSWVFSGGAEGARGLLTAIAGSLITVTGVVFSVTIVALQLASTQFTPRILRTFTSDRVNQLVLGIFIGTFTYALLVLRSVRSKSSDDEAFVPALAVAVAVLLAMVSIAFLVYFIHHASRSIQAAFILDRVTRRSLTELDARNGSGDDARGEFLEPDRAAGYVVAEASGYIQAFNSALAAEVVEDEGLTCRLTRRIGEHVIRGERILSVWPPPGAAVGEKLLRAVVIGSERTPENDIEFGIIEIADIAVRALSPGINDPTTALQCIDRLAEILAHWHCPTTAPDALMGVGGGMLSWPLTTFERATRLAFDQIRHFGGANPAVAAHATQVLARLVKITDESEHAALRRQIHLFERAASEAEQSPS